VSIRAFAALNLSIPVTRRIAEQVERRHAPLEAAGIKVAWVPPANYHLTLKFLGSVPEESLEAAADLLRRRLQGEPPFEARARRLGAFPSEREPRVLWVGVEAGEPLERVQRAVEAALMELGFDKEERAFHPHVTVGRVKIGGPLGELWRSEDDFGASRLTEVVLYESRTLRAGAEYVARQRVPLGRVSL
jgi:2'-5' RNA ligase